MSLSPLALAHLRARAERRRRLLVLVCVAGYLRQRPEAKLFLPAVPAGVFDLDGWDDALCWHEFRCVARRAQPYAEPDECAHGRFQKQHVGQLAAALLLPEVLVLDNGSRVHRVEALCITLWRMAYPTRLVAGIRVFYRSTSMLSRVFNTVVQHLVATFGAKINVRVCRRRRAALPRPLTGSSVRSPAAQSIDGDRLTADLLMRFADAVHAKGGALRHCMGFIDGTVRGIARPSRNQRHVFNGHKRKHALKYQSVTTPDGVIVHLNGPHEGKVHDASLLARSGLLDLLDEIAWGPEPERQRLLIYGDPAYGVSGHLVSPFKGAALTAEQQAFNASMSAVRVSVEWGFGKVVKHFAFVDYAPNQKVLLQPVGNYYTVAVLFTNCHSCLYGNQTSTFFGVPPPTLAQYLATLVTTEQT